MSQPCAYSRRKGILNPSTHFCAFQGGHTRRVVLKGASLGDVSREFGIIIAYALGINTLAIVSYRKRSC
jgi:hypothetical protein